MSKNNDNVESFGFPFEELLKGINGCRAHSSQTAYTFHPDCTTWIKDNKLYVTYKIKKPAPGGLGDLTQSYDLDDGLGGLVILESPRRRKCFWRRKPQTPLESYIRNAYGWVPDVINLGEMDNPKFSVKIKGKLDSRKPASESITNWYYFLSDGLISSHQFGKFSTGIAQKQINKIEKRSESELLIRQEPDRLFLKKGTFSIQYDDVSGALIEVKYTSRANQEVIIGIIESERILRKIQTENLDDEARAELISQVNSTNSKLLNDLDLRFRETDRRNIGAKIILKLQRDKLEDVERNWVSAAYYGNEFYGSLPLSSN